MRFGRGSFGLRDGDHARGDVEPLGGHDGVLRTIANALAAMILVTADGEIVNAAREGLEILHGVGHCVGPIGIRDDAHREAHLRGETHAPGQDGVKQERLTALEVDGFHARVLGLFQNFLDMLECQCPFLSRTAPHKAMLALERALVGQKDVKAREFHVCSLSISM